MRARHRAGLTGLMLAAAGGVGAISSASAPPLPSPTPPSTTPPGNTVPATTLGPPATTVAPTTTTMPRPPDLVAGIPWIQRQFASPCSDTSVQMIGGSAVDGSQLAVLDDVAALDALAGLAVAFLACHAADGSTTESTALLVRVTASGELASVAEQQLGPTARVVAVALPSFTVEMPEGAPSNGSCCAPLVRRRSYSVSTSGFAVTEDRQVGALLQTVGPPPIAADGDLVRSGIAPTALCFRWENVYLSTVDPGDEPAPVSTPSAELQTVRLALSHVTDRWITPSSVMTEEMADVVRMYQEARQLTVDGLVGAETTEALTADLGCDVGEFRQIDPIGLGPRRYETVTDLLAALDRYRHHGTTANASMTALLIDSGWDAANSLFLGCTRRDVPPTGVVCSWSGRTPLQLIGLVDDPASPGVTGFSVLYARTAAPA